LYKYLLCWRYLRTRYIALASIVSVLLGVATMIVVNSVMAGFSAKMRDRLHGILADVVVESYDLDGFFNSDEVMARIQSVAGDQIEAMAPAAETFGLMTFQVGGQSITRQVQIIGIRPEQRARTGDFAEYLTDGQRNSDGTERRIPPSFEIPESVKRATPSGRLLSDSPDDPFNEIIKKDLEAQADHGAIIGYALATIHRPGSHADQFIAPPGTQIKLTFPASIDREVTPTSSSRRRERRSS
jgi:lipoprotein-releasing system permease protein